ncbi:MAG TPA: hypothetical protein VF255_10890 [Solirubrobacterales bacterium]
MSGKRGRRDSRRKKPVAKKTNRSWTARLKHLPGWIGVGAAAVTLIAGLVAGAEFLIDTGDEVLSNEAGAVEVRQVIVANGLVGTKVGEDSRLLQTKASTPQLDISVLNTGKNPARLTEARITIVDSAYLPICEYGVGDMTPISWRYAVELPALPLPSERIVPRPLHQEVPPGEVDRFKLFFRAPSSGLDDFVYALRVALVADDGEAPVDAGAVVIGLPDAVLPGEMILPYGSRPFGGYRDKRLMSTWCARRNMTELKRVLRHPGRRSSSMSTLAELRPAGWWRDFADPRPPKAAARALLADPDFGEEPALAMFAAERSGDPAFEAWARRRAAAQLTRQTERWLRLGGAGIAAIQARQLIRISPSRAGRVLLARAEADLEAEEAEFAAEWEDR